MKQDNYTKQDKSNSDNNLTDILKNTLMYYQTTLRNVGLYTSISIALFSFSKFFVEYHHYNSKFIRICIRLLSIFVLSCACYICFNLYRDINNLRTFNPSIDTNKIIDVEKWHQLLIFILIVLSTLLLICIYVFILDIINNHFKNTNIKLKNKK